MIVLDASVAVEMLLETVIGDSLADRLLVAGSPLHVPHLLDVEVAQVLRRFVRHREIDVERANEALDDLAAWRLVRYPHRWLLWRVWELRENLTAYDATYVALTEALDATLLTRDQRLAGAPGHSARVEVV